MPRIPLIVSAFFGLAAPASADTASNYSDQLNVIDSMPKSFARREPTGHEPALIEK